MINKKSYSFLVR